MRHSTRRKFVLFSIAACLAVLFLMKINLEKTLLNNVLIASETEKLFQSRINLIDHIDSSESATIFKDSLAKSKEPATIKRTTEESTTIPKESTTILKEFVTVPNKSTTIPKETATEIRGSSTTPTLSTTIQQASITITTKSVTIPKESVTESNKNENSDFVISTPTCKLPKTPLWPKFYADNWNWQKKKWPDCTKDVTYFTLTENELLLQLNDSIPTTNCSAWEVSRDPESDNSYLIVNQRSFNSSVLPVNALEMIMVECNKNESNFEVTIPLKPSVLDKINYWSDKPEKPINVLIIGLDSTSRLHVLRSLPKTLEILEELGFVSLEGFHTIEPSTLPNFMAMLMGLSESEVRGTCASNWDTPFDNCPLIWKLYSENKYISVFNEDGSGTFNWGGQSGFTEPPTDYYLHPLLKAVNKIRQKVGKSLDEEQCVSSEGVPAFMIRYVRRFLEKFQTTPFFIFDYHTNPFHDSQFALPNFDHDLAEFFKFVKATPELLENTLLILMGDHGDRYNFFSYNSMESYLERALPPLFIRVPDRLQKQHPEFVENLQKNTKELTSAFDIHHTLLHILNLSGFPVLNSTTEFQSSWHNRSSLFHKVDPNRTCSSIGVGKGYCVCNTAKNAKTLDNLFFVESLIDFCIKELNLIVTRSKYSKVCEKWHRHEQTLVSANLLEETEDFQTVLLKIKVSPGGSQFSANLRVFSNSTSPEPRIEMDGEFSRINKYGDQSLCVGFDTDEDKRMKEFCYCKDKDD